MSRVLVPHSVWSSLRTPSGSPLMDVTMSNRSFVTWVRSASGSPPSGAVWPPRTAADMLRPMAQERKGRQLVSNRALGSHRTMPPPLPRRNPNHAPVRVVLRVPEDPDEAVGHQRTTALIRYLFAFQAGRTLPPYARAQACLRTNAR